MAAIEKDFRVKNGIVVDNGSIVLNGIGRIQGVDTVINPTDAASKEYVDTAVSNVSGGGGGGTADLSTAHIAFITLGGY